MMIEKAREKLAEKLHSVYCPNDGNCSYTDKDLMAVDVILAEPPEAGEFTKKARAIVERGATDNQEFGLLVLESCDIIDANKETIKHQAKRIEELGAENRWIPVGERLPEVKSGRYVSVIAVLLNNREEQFCMVMDFYGPTNWAHGLVNGYKNVTHWKPIILPEQALKEII